jgi:hypothetical protein
VRFLPRLLRMASRMRIFRSVPRKWCSDAYMCVTAVRGSAAQKSSHP